MTLPSCRRAVASNTVTAALVLPGAPRISTATAAPVSSSEQITVRWVDVANETSYSVQWSSSSTFTTTGGGLGSPGANAVTYTTANIARQVWYVRIRANNLVGSSAWSPVVTVASA